MTKAVPECAEALPAEFETRGAPVGVIGLGYVGLPLACAFARAGFPVTGFETDPAKVKSLTTGRSYIEHIPGEAISELVATGRLAANDDFARLGEMDAVLICVPTPLTPEQEPDMRFVKDTVASVARHHRAGRSSEQIGWTGHAP